MNEIFKNRNVCARHIVVVTGLFCQLIDVLLQVILAVRYNFCAAENCTKFIISCKSDNFAHKRLRPLDLVEVNDSHTIRVRGYAKHTVV